MTQRYHRKIIGISALDSPNVQLAMEEIARGEKPSGTVVVPGILSWDDYQRRLKLWDDYRKTVSLEGRFFEGGAETKLFPEEHLKRCVAIAEDLHGRIRKAEGMGIDPAEGDDESCWTIVDRLGIIHQKSASTKDTADIPGYTIGMIREYKINPLDVILDRGGGGKQHADLLRSKGLDVRTISFGESAHNPHRSRKTATARDPVKKRIDEEETRTAFRNRRAEMYWTAAEVVKAGFGIPSEYGELLRQLKMIPKLYNAEGMFFLPPKDKISPTYTGRTLRQILGRSPDQADSFVMAIYGMVNKKRKVVLRAL